MVDTLGTRIVTGRVPPGSPIDPVALEREFRVSRSVVRESLRVLTAKGLVDARPRLGTYVLAREEWVSLDPDVLRWRFSGPPDPGFLDELFEVRLIVEPMTTRLAALRRTPDDLAALGDALEAMRTARGDSPEAHVVADVAFHAALLAAAHNSLLDHLSPVVETGLQVRDAFVHDTLAHDAVGEHEAVLDAVAAADPARSEHAMRALLERSAADVDTAWAMREPHPDPT
ncbi:GntR family transcriptional regulator [Murinocardiopsis flavida]|uniref:GntR family transcriptional regulator n=1 Tax=Murinocardiopsis flavida TaxID=645275 RepID=A0A2P8CYY9_9ACTN|nr:GntR family transcriptional regulator [Murinocardiopsis flavida]